MATIPCIFLIPEYEDEIDLGELHTHDGTTNLWEQTICKCFSFKFISSSVL